MQPTGEEVRAQLQRLLASAALAGSTRLRRFLSFTVERALAGDGQPLKEYTVGIEVFDRGPDYDPRIDSIVRVEAGRLRARLDEYYRGTGSGDPVIIRIPRGGYTPIFEHRAAASIGDSGTNGRESGSAASRGRRVWWLAVGSAAAAMLAVTPGQFPRLQPESTPPVHRSEPAVAPPVAPPASDSAVSAAVTPARRPDRKVSRKSATALPAEGNGGAKPQPVPAVRVAVLPFAHYSTDPSVGLLAARLTDGVMTELVRNGRVDVVSRTSTQQFASRPGSLREVARALNADIVVEGSIHVDADRIRVQMRMVDPDVDRKFGLHEFEGTARDLDDLQRRMAAAISTYYKWRSATLGSTRDARRAGQ
jgi:TolB-like protein